MEEAPCGLIIRATPQVPYSLTAVLYKFCHLVKTVRNTDPSFFSNWHFEAHSFNQRRLIAGWAHNPHGLSQLIVCAPSSQLTRDGG